MTAPTGNMGSPVSLVYPERSAPLAVLAAAKLAGVDIAVKPDAKLGKDAPPTLIFASGWVLERGLEPWTRRQAPCMHRRPAAVGPQPPPPTASLTARAAGWWRAGTS